MITGGRSIYCLLFKQKQGLLGVQTRMAVHKCKRILSNNFGHYVHNLIVRILLVDIVCLSNVCG